MVDRVSPETLEEWLEWAAVRLIAMPAGRLKPQDVKAYWPDFQREILPGVSDLQVNRIRAMAPSSDEISIVDLISPLPNLSDHPDTRRVLHWRAQVHPLSHRHLLTWPWIAGKLEIKIHTAKLWHRAGLAEVARKVPPTTVCRITTFMADRL